MIVRLADFNTDALAIAECARQFAQSTSLASWFRSGNEFVEDISKVMVLDNLEITVAEHEGKISGGIGIVYVPFIWNHSILVGDELFWWVYPDAPFRTGRALFDFAMTRIKEKGAKPMFRSLDTSPEHVWKFYEREGLKQFESVYTEVK